MGFCDRDVSVQRPLKKVGRMRTLSSQPLGGDVGQRVCQRAVRDKNNGSMKQMNLRHSHRRGSAGF